MGFTYPIEVNSPPLTRLAALKKSKRRVVSIDTTATNCLLGFPDHNLPFQIETYASDFQLGSIIKQEGSPVAYYSQKLNHHSW